jgi:hypothetical protein
MSAASRTPSFIGMRTSSIAYGEEERMPPGIPENGRRDGLIVPLVRNQGQDDPRGVPRSWWIRIVALRIAFELDSDSPVWRLRENAGMKLPHSTTRTRCPRAKRLPVRRFGRRSVTISPATRSLRDAPPSRSLARRDVGPRAREVPGRPVGRDVLELDPEIGVRSVGGEANLGLDRADHAQRLGEGLGLEDEDVLAPARAR